MAESSKQENQPDNDTFEGATEDTQDSLEREKSTNAPELEKDTTQDAGSQGGPKKKLFGWLSSRNTSTSSLDKTLKSGPSHIRRGTVSSILSNGSNVDRPMSHGEEDGTVAAKKMNRISLKDQFKLVRMREEAGIITFDALESSPPGSSGDGVVIEDGPALVRSDSDAADQNRKRTSSNITLPPAQPTINVHLPPGTAAGTSTGPAPEAAEPVDWDLWQEVVYEGPAAVARTSAHELNQATMRGIPSAIRGVVWQVLASSKNEELESVYRDLVARGKPRDRRPSDMKAQSTSLSRMTSEGDLSVPEIPAEKTSSRSSVKSEVDTGDPSRRSSVALASPNSQDDSSTLDALVGDQAQAIADEKARALEQNNSLQKLERAIRRDLGARTSYSKFLMSAGLQDGLFGVCKAYALFDEEVGYAQGMNFIAMPLLFNMAEEEAFCLFVRLMNNYNLRDLFIPDMPGLHLHLYQFDRLLEDLEPAVYCHLHRRGVTSQLYATQWFLTLFAYRFPLQLVLRIYDLILSEGLESAILKFGIVLMRKNAVKLLEMKDMAVLTTFLKDRIFDCYIDKSPSASSLLESGFFGSAGGIDKEVYRADALVQDACEINITPELLRTYTSEWQLKVREDKERQAAEDATKLANISLTAQVQRLQERCKASDAEHGSMASEIVRIKVENQRLADENEGLQVRIRELQEIVQSQPGEVEEKLRHEMDRIMKRNIEVQNENRALEESTAEMEGELIDAKMKHAEIHAELDSMRQKWSSVAAMMSGVGSPPAS